MTAFACHHILLSGVILLLSSPIYVEQSRSNEVFEGAESCSCSRSALENSQPGATRCRELLSELIRSERRDAVRSSTIVDVNCVTPPAPPLVPSKWEAAEKTAMRCKPGEGPSLKRKASLEPIEEPSSKIPKYSVMDNFVEEPTGNSGVLEESSFSGMEDSKYIPSFLASLEANVSSLTDHHL